MHSCLLAKHKHKSGKDSTASCGVSISSGGKSVIHCFGCGTSGEITGVLFELLMLNRQQEIPSPHIVKALEYMDLEDMFVFDPDEHWGISSVNGDIEGGLGMVFTPFPDTWLNSFSSATKSSVAMAYLKSRNVPDRVIEDFDLRFDHAKQAVGFPYYNAYKGKLAGMRGRIVDLMSAKKHHDYSYDGKNNTSVTWFRESKLTGEKPVVVVEGQFDCARVYQAYRNVTAILTAYPSELKMDFLLKFPEIIWFSDNDAAGLGSAKKAEDYFKSKGRKIYVVKYNEGDPKDPDGFDPKMLKYYLSDYVPMDELILDSVV